MCIGLSLWGRLEKILLCCPNAAPLPLDLLPPEGKCFPYGGGICYQPLYGHCLSLPKLNKKCPSSLHTACFPKTISAISPSLPNAGAPLECPSFEMTRVGAGFSVRTPYVLDVCYASRTASLSSAPWSSPWHHSPNMCPHWGRRWSQTREERIDFTVLGLSLVCLKPFSGVLDLFGVWIIGF